MLDESYGWESEFPFDFSYNQEVKKVEIAKYALEKEIGIMLNLDVQGVQDSYFFAEVGYYQGARENSDLLFNVRFSSFGHLVTAWISPSFPPMEKDVLNVTCETLEEQGYIFVDSDWLMRTKYDCCRNTFGKTDVSWWDRFFDYS
jgi:hypothetical protein